jgi:hypothetical protein
MPAAIAYHVRVARESTLLKRLQDAIADLTYPSDSDEPWEAFLWPATPADRSVRDALQNRVDKSRAIVEVPIEQFFEPLNESDDAPKYAQLRRVLRDNLNDLQAFRVGDGEVRVEVYLLGIAAGGAIGGIRTISVET